ncbi:MAG: hypothetical protein APF81_27390 [Desulfosporosinus sp. BRH_c37]|nr:MAG: hypothetical protein APF81_27390 [Desulfosporosinus sp. BRH_c37]
MLLAVLEIPQMFTAYAEDLQHLNTGLHHYQYYCEQCDQLFASAWGISPGSMGRYERGGHFVCPHCGQSHHGNVAYIKREAAAPSKMRLAVKEYKNVVTLEVVSETVEFRDYLRIWRGTRKEVFRFIISEQSASFSVGPIRGAKEPIELGNPFKLEMLKESILWFFHLNSLANSKKRTDLSNLLKVLRETVHRKLEKYLGHKITSMFVHPGQFHGTFLLPIFNIAYRLSCPDAPNLPVEYRDNPKEIQSYWKRKMLSNVLSSEKFSIGLMDRVIALTRRKKDFVTAIIKTKSLPDRPMVRRTLREDPFSVNILAEAFDLCVNYDYAIRMYEGIKELANDTRVRWTVNDDLFQFLREMRPLYGEIGVVRLVEGYMESQLWDCVTLFQQLNEENIETLKSETIRLRDLHDWMSLRHKKQTHKNLKFNVPDHIIKRLSMQTDRLKFFMPKESLELLEAGHSLHNCVASYGQAMKDNSKWIVLVADDKGKLAVCLEIKGNELIQAKTNSNKAISGDKELNSAVIAWAKEANLEINTPDIKLKDKKEPKMGCSSMIYMPA